MHLHRHRNRRRVPTMMTTIPTREASLVTIRTLLRQRFLRADAVDTDTNGNFTGTFTLGNTRIVEERYAY